MHISAPRNPLDRRPFLESFGFSVMGALLLGCIIWTVHAVLSGFPGVENPTRAVALFASFGAWVVDEGAAWVYPTLATAVLAFLAVLIASARSDNDSQRYRTHALMALLSRGIAAFVLTLAFFAAFSLPDDPSRAPGLYSVMFFSLLIAALAIWSGSLVSERNDSRLSRARAVQAESLPVVERLKFLVPLQKALPGLRLTLTFLILTVLSTIALLLPPVLILQPDGLWAAAGRALRYDLTVAGVISAMAVAGALGSLLAIFALDRKWQRFMAGAVILLVANGVPILLLVVLVAGGSHAHAIGVFLAILLPLVVVWAPLLNGVQAGGRFWPGFVAFDLLLSVHRKRLEAASSLIKELDPARVPPTFWNSVAGRVRSWLP